MGKEASKVAAPMEVEEAGQTSAGSSPTGPPDHPPPQDGQCLLLKLPASIRVVITTYLSYEWRKLESTALLSRAFQEANSLDTVWQQLCKDYWFVQEEHFTQWPKIRSWKALYRLLEQWATLEGFYTLPSAFPWCLLVVLRFEQGRLVAEALRFCPSEDGAKKSKELRARLFEVTFAEEAEGVRASISFHTGAEAQLEGDITVQPLPEAVRSALPATYFDGRDPRVLPCWIAATRGLCLQLGGAGIQDEGECNMVHLWAVNGWDSSAGYEKLTETTTQMVAQLLVSTGQLPLSLVRGPMEYILDDPGAPHLRPGLYVGNYGHAFYGQFKHEVLLVEFRQCAKRDVGALFARPFEGGGVPPQCLAALEGVLEDEECSFLMGTKVTGDMHVPAGQTTFVAILTPKQANEKLERDRGGRALTAARNRTTGGQENVQTSWPGFGTLAMPGFKQPSWAPGWLVQFEAGHDAAGGSGDRFGFMWDRDEDVIVLEYIQAQTASPWLSRKWLPAALR